MSKVNRILSYKPGDRVYLSINAWYFRLDERPWKRIEATVDNIDDPSGVCVKGPELGKYSNGYYDDAKVFIKIEE